MTLEPWRPVEPKRVMRGAEGEMEATIMLLMIEFDGLLSG